jgi:hypothetical protein
LVAENVFHVHGLGDHILSYRPARIIFGHLTGGGVQFVDSVHEERRLSVDDRLYALAVPIISETSRVVGSIDSSHRHHAVFRVVAEVEFLGNGLPVRDGSIGEEKQLGDSQTHTKQRFLVDSHTIALNVYKA